MYQDLSAIGRLEKYCLKNTEKYKSEQFHFGTSEFDLVKIVEPLLESKKGEKDYSFFFDAPDVINEYIFKYSVATSLKAEIILWAIKMMNPSSDRFVDMMLSTLKLNDDEPVSYYEVKVKGLNSYGPEEQIVATIKYMIRQLASSFLYSKKKPPRYVVEKLIEIIDRVIPYLGEIEKSVILAEKIAVNATDEEIDVYCEQIYERTRIYTDLNKPKGYRIIYKKEVQDILTAFTVLRHIGCIDLFNEMKKMILSSKARLLGMNKNGWENVISIMSHEPLLSKNGKYRTMIGAYSVLKPSQIEDYIDTCSKVTVFPSIIEKKKITPEGICEICGKQISLEEIVCDDEDTVITVNKLHELIVEEFKEKYSLIQQYLSKEEKDVFREEISRVKEYTDLDFIKKICPDCCNTLLDEFYDNRSGAIATALERNKIKEAGKQLDEDERIAAEYALRIHHCNERRNKKYEELCSEASALSCGLYPHEIIAILQCERYTTGDNQLVKKANMYSAKSVGTDSFLPILINLEERGYVTSKNIEAILNHQTVAILGDYLNLHNLKKSGRKSELVKRIIESIPEDDILKDFPCHVFSMTVSGKSILEKYPFLPELWGNILYPNYYGERTDIWAIFEKFGNSLENLSFEELVVKLNLQELENKTELSDECDNFSAYEENWPGEVQEFLYKDGTTVSEVISPFTFREYQAFEFDHRINYFIEKYI